MGHIENIELFVRVVEAGSLTEAAAQMGLAKSAVSRRLAELERRLGVRLIARTTRTSALTEEGRRFYQHGLQLLDDVEHFNALAKKPSETELSGVLRLAAPLSFGLLHLTEALNEFCSLHPKLKLDINFEDRHVDLVAGGFDCAIRGGELKNSNLQARKVAPLSIVLCASPAYLKQYGTPKTPKDLTKHSFLHYQNKSNRLLTLVKPCGETESVLPAESRIKANNGEFLLSLAASGHGITACPSFICWKALAQGTVLRVLPEYQIPDQSLYVVYPENRFVPLRVRLFIEFIHQRFAVQPCWDE